MTDPEWPELIRVCKEMLDRQDRLIASLKKVGCDCRLGSPEPAGIPRGRTATATHIGEVDEAALAISGQFLALPCHVPGMVFDAQRWPNAITIGWLIAERMGLGVHCQKCGRHAVLDPSKASRA